MKDSITKKLTLIIETTNGNDISKDVMMSVSSLQRTVASHKDIKLSLSFKEEQPNNFDQYCQANWDYWPM
jgi:hypothetical protein